MKFCIRLTCSCLVVFFIALPHHSQANADSTAWDIKTKTSLFFAQSSYGQYWKGSGRSSLELGGDLLFTATRTVGKNTIENKVILQYGVIKVGQKTFQKNEDRLEVEARYSRKVSKYLKLSGLFNFRTHMHDFYSLNADGDRLRKTGNFMAPGFFHLGTGLDFGTKDKVLRVYYTPLNSKLTVVTDRELRAQYLPAMLAKQALRYELGSLVRVQIEKELMTNIVFKSTGTFFTSHLQNFGNFDVNLEGDLNFKVNKHFRVNLRTQLIYDEDIMFDLVTPDGEGTGQKGPRTQFKEVLNLGLSHTF
ncbi:MAG: DUF3078 domain-containing protein [Saprospiraceae bacterium]|nr:DUF3078 domain-containing protein [Saprospiraceae bacterium]